MLKNLDQIETVLLDMDGTLLDLHFDNYFWQQYVPDEYSQSQGLTREEALAKLVPIFKSHEGTLNWYCVDFWSNQLGFDVMEHKDRFLDKIAYRPTAESFLALCKTKVPDTRLVTNGHRKVLRLKHSVTSIEDYFSETVCSHELGAPKEEQLFWQRLQGMNSFDPDTTLFIDDNEHVLDSAHRYGIKHLYSIKQPDSVIPRKTESKYPMLESFAGFC